MGQADETTTHRNKPPARGRDDDAMTNWRRSASSREPERLAHLVERACSAESTSRSEAARDFIAYRFLAPYERARRAAPWYRTASTMLTLAAAVGGLGTTAATVLGQTATSPNGAISGGQITVAVLGALVVVVAALNQTWRPGERANRYGQACHAYGREGWDYVLRRGRYAVCAPEKAWEVFVDEVSRIGRSAEAVTESPASKPNEGT